MVLFLFFFNLVCFLNANKRSWFGLSLSYKLHHLPPPPQNLTGELSSEVKTFPAFPGNEANYLRAQIARIAASTIVAPRGFFTTEVEDEEDDDIGGGSGAWNIYLRYKRGCLKANTL